MFFLRRAIIVVSKFPKSGPYTMGQFFTVGVNISMRTSSHGDPYYLVLIKSFLQMGAGYC